MMNCLRRLLCRLLHLDCPKDFRARMEFVTVRHHPIFPALEFCVIAVSILPSPWATPAKAT